jgi:hypothetical protein
LLLRQPQVEHWNMAAVAVLAMPGRYLAAPTVGRQPTVGRHPAATRPRPGRHRAVRCGGGISWLYWLAIFEAND